MKTNDLFNNITETLFRSRSKKVNIIDALTELANEIDNNNEVDWSIGECAETTLGDLIVGAYWALSEWHAGQWSPSYAALCALRKISPGMSNAPKEDDSEYIAYWHIGEWCRENQSLL